MIPALGTMRQEDCGFEISIIYSTLLMFECIFIYVFEHCVAEGGTVSEVLLLSDSQSF